jgi:hypothetical protein
MQISVTRALVALIVAGLAPSAPAAATEPEVLGLLPQLLASAPYSAKNSFRVSKGDKGWRMLYCPDNTCDVIRADLRMPRADLGDFALLYLYYASDYIYLKNFYYTEAKPHVGRVLARRSNGCPSDSEYATASCALLRLAKAHGISLAFRRSDEGQTAESPVKLQDRLSANAIEATKRWQIDQWKSFP